MKALLNVSFSWRGVQVLSRHLQGFAFCPQLQPSLFTPHSATGCIRLAYYKAFGLQFPLPATLFPASFGQLFTFNKVSLISWLKLHYAFQVPLSSLAQFHVIFHILPNNLTLRFYYFMIWRTSSVLRTGAGEGQCHSSLMTVVLTSEPLGTGDYLDNHISILSRADLYISQPLTV